MTISHTNDIFSPKYGVKTVIAPLRFKERIEAYRWYVHRDPNRVVGREFQVVSNVKQSGTWVKVRLHRLIWELAGNPDTPQIDHHDGQPLNNAEDNLRAATPVENQQNRHLQRHNTSGVVGVTWSKQRSKWMAYIKADGKRVYLGFFDTIQAAQLARDAGALKYFGEFAVLNTPIPPENDLPVLTPDEYRAILIVMSQS